MKGDVVVRLHLIVFDEKSLICSQQVAVSKEFNNGRHCVAWNSEKKTEPTGSLEHSIFFSNAFQVQPLSLVNTRSMMQLQRQY